MTKYWYDTEFHEDGSTIDLISIGILCEDGREYYAVNLGMDVHRIKQNDWLMRNVWPHLPVHDSGLMDIDHPAVKSPLTIADEVRDFILAKPDPELWAWYGAYDHVALCQLWGKMIDLPKGIPMWTNDLKQECMRLGNPKMPKQVGEHHALADARHNKVMDEFLASLELAA